MLADYHVRCMFSEDSWYAPEKEADDAWKSNLDEICFTDHVDYGFKPDIKLLAQTAAALG